MALMASGETKVPLMLVKFKLKVGTSGARAHKTEKNVPTERVIHFVFKPEDIDSLFV